MVFERIQQAVLFFWNNLLSIFLITVPFALISSAAQLFVGPILVTDGTTLQSINGSTATIVLLTQIVGEAALICQLSSLTEGKRRSLLDCMIFAAYVFLPLTLTMLLMSLPLATSLLIGAASAGAAGGAALILFVPAGIWSYLRLSLAPFYLALERLTPTAALQKSIQRTAADQWPLLASWMLTMVMAMITASAVGGIITDVFGSNGGSNVIISILQKMLGAIVTVVLFQAYQRLLTPPTPPAQ